MQNDLGKVKVHIHFEGVDSPDGDSERHDCETLRENASNTLWPSIFQSGIRFLLIFRGPRAEKPEEKAGNSLPDPPVQRSNSVRPRGYKGVRTP